jgi:xanthine dehydrogenase molybdenum-binding subunit
VALPDTAFTPDSGTTTASRQTLVTGEACRRACAAVAAAATAAATAARASLADPAAADRGREPPFALAALSGLSFSAEFEAATDPFDSDKTHPVRHVAYSYACHLAVLGGDGRLEKIVAAHDSGLVVNPLAFTGQVEGGVVMGLGYALTETFPLADCVPMAKFGQLGLLRATEVPPIETIIVRRAGPGQAADGGTGASAYGAKGIGEISTIPTAAAVAGAYAALDGIYRKSLPLDGTPYWKK